MITDLDEDANVVVANGVADMFVPLLHYSPPPITTLESYQNLNLLSVFPDATSISMNLGGTSRLLGANDRPASVSLDEAAP